MDGLWQSCHARATADTLGEGKDRRTGQRVDGGVWEMCAWEIEIAGDEGKGARRSGWVAFTRLLADDGGREGSLSFPKKNVTGTWSQPFF